MRINNEIMDYIIRKHTLSDNSKILTLFDSNTPKYFSPTERKDLENYLEKEIEDYFVLETHDKILATGGINYNSDVAIISWDFVDPNFQGKGLGSILLNHRIKYIQKNNPGYPIKVRTSQLTDKFYEKNGFQEIQRIKDYWAKGFDLVEMIFQHKNWKL